MIYRRYSLGIDPGASAAMALVEYGLTPGRRLAGMWSIYGASRPRADRKADALREVAEIIGVRRNDAGRIIGRAYLDVWIELPAAGGASVNRNGWQLAVGRSIGRFEAEVALSFGVVARMIKANVWPKVCGVRCGKHKRDEGLHRVQEARIRLEDSEAWVAGMAGESAAARERRIALAEACLIAFAGSK